MTAWTIPAALVGLVALAAPARADQCEWVPSNVARIAMEELASHDNFIAFCEPCGDKVPGAPQKIETITKSSVGDGSWEVRINGRAVDLAYTYAPIHPREYQNVGLLAACGATGVSGALRVEGAAPNGVLIYPSEKTIASKVQPEPDPEPAPEPAPAVAPAPAAVAPVLPTIIVMSSTTTSAPSWWPALAGAGGASAIWLAWAMAAARRRRGAMAPRAAHLVDRGSKL